jgi:hypothetical protein
VHASQHANQDARAVGAFFLPTCESALCSRPVASRDVKKTLNKT